MSDIESSLLTFTNLLGSQENSSLNNRDSMSCPINLHQEASFLIKDLSSKGKEKFTQKNNQEEEVKTSKAKKNSHEMSKKSEKIIKREQDSIEKFREVKEVQRANVENEKKISEECQLRQESPNLEFRPVERNYNFINRGKTLVQVLLVKFLPNSTKFIECLFILFILFILWLTVSQKIIIESDTYSKEKIRECLIEDIFYNQNICMENEDFCQKFSQNNLSILEKNHMIFEEYHGWSFNENKIGIEVIEIMPFSNCKKLITISKDAIRLWDMKTLKVIMHSSKSVKLYAISHDETFVIYSTSAGDAYKLNLQSPKIDAIRVFFFAEPISKILISDDSELIVLMFEKEKDILAFNSTTLNRLQTYTKVVGPVKKVEIDGQNNDVIIQDSEGIKIYSLYSNLPIVIKTPSDLKKWSKIYFKLKNFE